MVGVACSSRAGLFSVPVPQRCRGRGRRCSAGGLGKTPTLSKISSWDCEAVTPAKLGPGLWLGVEGGTDVGTVEVAREGGSANDDDSEVVRPAGAATSPAPCGCDCRLGAVVAGRTDTRHLGQRRRACRRGQVGRCGASASRGRRAAVGRPFTDAALRVTLSGPLAPRPPWGFVSCPNCSRPASGSTSHGRTTW